MHEFPLDEVSEEDVPDVWVSSRELPDIVGWKNRQSYDITYKHRNARQVQRIEKASGEVIVGLKLQNETEVDGELST